MVRGLRLRARVERYFLQTFSAGLMTLAYFLIWFRRVQHRLLDDNAGLQTPSAKLIRTHYSKQVVTRLTRVPQPERSPMNASIDASDTVRSSSSQVPLNFM